MLLRGIEEEWIAPGEEARRPAVAAGAIARRVHNVAPQTHQHALPAGEPSQVHRHGGDLQSARHARPKQERALLLAPAAPPGCGGAHTVCACAVESADEPDPPPPPHAAVAQNNATAHRPRDALPSQTRMPHLQIANVSVHAAGPRANPGALPRGSSGLTATRPKID